MSNKYKIKTIQIIHKVDNKEILFYNQKKLKLTSKK